MRFCFTREVRKVTALGLVGERPPAVRSLYIWKRAFKYAARAAVPAAVAATERAMTELKSRLIYAFQQMGGTKTEGLTKYSSFQSII